MKYRLKSLAIAIGLAILVFSNTLTALYVFVNIINWKIDILNINPSEPENERDFPIMSYPPSNGSLLQITDSKKTILFEDMRLAYNGTLVENRPVEFSAIATLDPSFANQTYGVYLSFDGAVPYPVKSGMGFSNAWGISLYPTNMNEDQGAFMISHNILVSLGAFLVGESVVMTWQVQGDYYPSISIIFKNFTRISQDYTGNQNFEMHVDSASVLEQQNSDRIDTSTTVALAFFGFVDGSVFVGRFLLTRRKQEDKKPSDLEKAKTDNEQQPTNEPSSQPQKSERENNKERDKSKTSEQSKNERETEKS
jgi:hypothetical protein